MTKKTKIRRKSKRVHKIKMADGKIWTILDADPNPQTELVRLWVRQSVGVELLIIPVALLFGAGIGWFTFKYMGLLAGTVISGILAIILVSQSGLGSKPKPLDLPQGSIIGWDSFYQFKSRSYTFCCHDYDSDGNEVVDANDPISIMAWRLKAKDRLIKHIRNEIRTLSFRISEGQIGQDELVDRVSRNLKSIMDSTVVPARAKVKYTKPSFPDYPPPGTEPEEGET